jgi:hypothetical protein
LEAARLAYTAKLGASEWEAFIDRVPPCDKCKTATNTRLRALLLQLVAVELDRALDRFPTLNGPHEGKAVIEEELDELWEHVKANTGRTMAARREAIQVAAMALRYVLDVTGVPDGGPEYDR